MKQRLSEMHANEVKYSRHISDLLEMQTADEVRHQNEVSTLNKENTANVNRLNATYVAMELKKD